MAQQLGINQASHEGEYLDQLRDQGVHLHQEDGGPCHEPRWGVQPAVRGLLKVDAIGAFIALMVEIFFQTISAVS